MTTTKAAFFATAPRRKGVLQVLLTADDLWRERRALARLDADALADIGYTAREAEIEARRPVWDAPDRWLG